METKIQTYSHPQFGDIRCMMDDKGEPWFVGKDVAEKLGYAKARNAITAHVDEEDKKDAPIQGILGGVQMMTVINESGMYSLILSSKLPQAKEFKHWVTSVVLPQIRQTGGYIPLTTKKDGECKREEILASALHIAQKTINMMNHQLEADRPKLLFANAVSKSVNSVLIRDLAKMITQAGVPMGAGRLFYWLRLHEYIFKRELRPRQEWVERGIFELCVTTYQVGGKTFEKVQTRVTGIGQQYFVNGFVSGRFCAENGCF